MPFFERTLSQVMRVHHALYDNNTSIEERGRRYKIETVNEPGKKFRQVKIGKYTFVSQNMDKPSPATEEIRRAEERGEKVKITWVMHPGYVGRITTTAKDGKPEEYRVNDFVRNWQNKGLVDNIKWQGRRER